MKPRQSIFIVVWHPNDMRLAIVSNNYHDEDNYVFIRGVSDEGNLLTTLVGHNGLIFSVGWSPDGTVRIWDTTIYETLAVLEG